MPSNGRSVVFAVSGEIHPAGGIKTRITGNKLIIADQTAPGDGIQLRDGTLRISDADGDTWTQQFAVCIFKT